MKRWLRTGAIVALGAGAGTGAALLGHHALGKVVGQSWTSMAPQTKAALLGAAGATVGTGVGLAARALARERMKHMDDDE